MSCRILVGDARERLADLPDQSVHCVVTSPPYWGMRSYDDSTHAEGMIGLEATFDEFLDNIVDVFAEVHRVLRDDGTLWLNMGDSYAGSGTTGNTESIQGRNRGGNNKRATPDVPGLQPKDLLLQPYEVAVALRRAHQWIIRADNKWVKPNPMPESCRDRTTQAHETVWQLVKQGRYYYDQAAVRTPGSPNTHARRKDGQRLPPKGGGDRFDRRAGTLKETRSIAEQAAIGANLRNVWIIPIKAYPEAHFATFPPDLVMNPIKAGTSEKGVCAECGAPWTRQIKTHAENIGNRQTNGPRSIERQHSPQGSPGFAVRMEIRTETTGWEPSCDCDADRVPAVVLDPFGGAGTVGLVADGLGRDSILIEISDEYAELAAARITPAGSMFGKVEIER